MPLSGPLSGSLLCLSPDSLTVFDVHEGSGDTLTARSIALATSSCAGGADPSRPSKGILFPGDEDSVKRKTASLQQHQASQDEGRGAGCEPSAFQERENLKKILRRGFVRGGGLTHILNGAGMLRKDLIHLPTVLFNQSDLQVDLRDCLTQVVGDQCCLFVLRDTGRFLMAHFVSPSLCFEQEKKMTRRSSKQETRHSFLGFY